MRRRWILLACCVLPMFGWSQEALEKKEVADIEQKIEVLKKKLKQERLKEIKEEVDGQESMIADWEGYREDVEQIRKLDEKELQIEKEIEQLEQQKAQLLKQSN